MGIIINLLTAFRAMLLLICAAAAVGFIILFRRGIKKTGLPKILIPAICICGIAASAYLPARMFLADKSFSPKYEMNNLDETFERFDEMFEYGTKRLNSNDVAASSENYLVFESIDAFDCEPVYDCTVFCFLSRYSKNYDSESGVEYLKNNAADTGEKDGIIFWRSDIRCETAFPGAQFIWCVGSVLLENENGDSIKVEFQFRDYEDYSLLFPSYPGEFNDLSMLTFDTVYAPWKLV